MDYPSILPLPLRSGYGLTPENNIIRTEMVSGRARQRVQYTSIPSYANLSWLLTQTQAQLFESWSSLVGADWFSLTLKTPLGLSPYDCRFMATPKGPTLEGVSLWRYTAEVELRDRPLLDGSYTLYPSIVLMQDIFDIAMNREWAE